MGCVRDWMDACIIIIIIIIIIIRDFSRLCPALSRSQNTGFEPNIC
jgi:hypothetical protein